MPKPRLSYEQAKARGSEQVNAGRFASRKDAPATTGTIGDPPRHLTTPEKKVWKELTAVIPAGVAGESDRIAVEIASRLLYQFRSNPTGMQTSRLNALMDVMSRLGLDPQARTRLHVEQKPDPKANDPLTRYMNALTHDTTETIQ